VIDEVVVVAELARGTVFDRPWGKTLAAITSKGVTAQLTVTEGDNEFIIAFGKGAIVGAYSPLAADSTVRLALTSGLINSTQATEIVRRIAVNAPCDDIEIIYDVASTKPELLAKLRRKAMATQAARTFALDRGSFVLADAITIPTFVHSSIDIRALIYMAARTAMSDDRLERDFEHFPFAMKLLPEVVPHLAQYGFTEGERGVLELLNRSPQTMADLESAPTGVEIRAVRCMVYALACTNAFAMTTDTRPTAKNSKSSSGLSVKKDSVVPTAPIVEKRSHRSTGQRDESVGTSSSNIIRPTLNRQNAEKLQRELARTTDAPRGVMNTPRPTQPPPAPMGRQNVQGTSPPQTTSTPYVRGTGVAAAVNAQGVAVGAINSAMTAATTALIRERLHHLDRGADHFALLGVNENTSPDQIRSAYFALARQLHPDRLTSVGIVELRREAQRLFAQINTAFSVLTNPQKRVEYVQVLRQGGETVVKAKQAEAEQLTTRILAAEEAFHRGEMALRRSQFEAAIADFTAAIASNPDEGDYHASLAWATFCCATDKHSVEKVVRQQFEKAMKLAPRSAIALVYFGRLERMLGNNTAARDKFEQALQRQPGHAEASSELRVLDARQGHRSDDKPEKSKPGLFGSMFKK
jgi:tetratricopeptide (TPR) repeat protein